MTTVTPRVPTNVWHSFLPKLVTTFQEGYSPAGVSASVAATLRDMHALPRENATIFDTLDAAAASATAKAHH